MLSAIILIKDIVTLLEARYIMSKNLESINDVKGYDYAAAGKRMRARREQLDWSLNQTAQKIGCTATTLKRWEEGTIKSIKTSRMKDIATALQTTVTALFYPEAGAKKSLGELLIFENGYFGIKAKRP